MTPVDRLNQHIRQGTLIRKAWTGVDAQGRATACLLAAMSTRVAKDEDASSCPASIMPSWLAHLTPWFDDAPSDRAWPAVVMRYAALARRWSVLTRKDWQQLNYRCRALSVREAMRHTDDDEVLCVCEHVAVLCERASSGKKICEDTWATAQEATLTAVRRAAPWNVHSVARAAEYATQPEDTPTAVAEVAVAAQSAAADLFVHQILDAMEQAIAFREGK